MENIPTIYNSTNFSRATVCNLFFKLKITRVPSWNTIRAENRN